MTIQTYPDLNALSVAAATLFAESANAAIADRGQFLVALAGGNTPAETYRLLASAPFIGSIDWAKVQFFFGDERWVPSADPESNEGMARNALLNHLPIQSDQIHPLFQPGFSVEQACLNYENLLRKVAPSGLDLILLGMGDDGHTASLFPGIPELAEKSKWVVPTLSPKGVPQRITLTVPALCLAKSIAFLVSGAAKTKEFRLATGGDPALFPPSGVIAHQSPNAIWLVDQAAAGI